MLEDGVKQGVKGLKSVAKSLVLNDTGNDGNRIPVKRPRLDADLGQMWKN